MRLQTMHLRRTLIFALALSTASQMLHAQPPVLLADASAPAPATAAENATASTNDLGVEGIVPIVKGFNISVVSTSQHDSSSGWSNQFTTDAAYRLNHYLSADFSFPWYMYVNVNQPGGTILKPTNSLITVHNVLGDSSLAAHLDLHSEHLDYNFTASGGFPTGNTTYALGSGQYTYDTNNHFETSLGIVTPDIELGIGDASNLVDRRIIRTDTILGTLAHFQAGSSIQLPFNINFDAEAYEILPTANLDTYRTFRVTRRRSISLLTGRGPTEDNGFNTTLDIPLPNPHFVLSGFYNRSLRQHDDTAGFSITFLLRPPPKAKDKK